MPTTLLVVAAVTPLFTQAGTAAPLLVAVAVAPLLILGAAVAHAMRRDHQNNASPSARSAPSSPPGTALALRAAALWASYRSQPRHRAGRIPHAVTIPTAPRAPEDSGAHAAVTR